MLDLQAMPQTLGGKVPRGVTRKTQCFRDWWAEQRVAKRVEHQGQGAFSDMMRIVTRGQLRDEAANGIEDRV